MVNLCNQHRATTLIHTCTSLASGVLAAILSLKSQEVEGCKSMNHTPGQASLMSRSEALLFLL